MKNHCIISFAMHYNDVIMSAMASQITSLTSVYSNVYSGADQRKGLSSPSLAFVREIHRWNSPHKGSETRKMFPLMTSSWNWDHFFYVWLSPAFRIDIIFGSTNGADAELVYKTDSDILSKVLWYNNIIYFLQIYVKPKQNIMSQI